MVDGRVKLAQDLADSEALRAAEATRKQLEAKGASAEEISQASDDEYRRVYEETFREAMQGGS